MKNETLFNHIALRSIPEYLDRLCDYSGSLYMEEWKEIEGYGNENFQYHISNHGEVVKNYLKGLMFKPKIHPYGGYCGVTLYIKNGSKSHMVHRLVATAFIPNPENKPFVNHLDGNKRNNRVDNLEWCTAKENTQHALKKGLIKSGENGCKSIISNKQALDIRKRAKFGMTGAEISKVLNINKQIVYNIINGNTYKYIDYRTL